MTIERGKQPSVFTPEPVEYHILCVDDDHDFLRSLGLFLPGAINKSRPSDVWYRFHFVSGPFEALELMRELVTAGEPIAMIISDQKMPGMKGTELFVQTHHLCETSIRVLLTGHAGMESAITAINDRLLDKYLTKPIENEHDFTVSIEHLLQRFHMSRALDAQERFIRKLYAFSNTLNRMECLQDMLDYVVSFTRETLDCARISILLLDGNELRIAAALGLSEEVVRETRVPVGEKVAGKVFGSRKAILSTSAEPFPYLTEGSRDDASSFISMPILYAGMVSGEKPLGVINVTNKRGNASFTELDLEMLEYITSTASTAVHNQINRSSLEQAYEHTREQAAALADANSRLKIVDQLKTDFLDFISHELRTPLSLMSAIDLVEKCDSPQSTEQMIGIVRDGYARLNTLIANGLDYFRWSATESVATAPITDLAAVVSRTCAGHPGLQQPDVDFDLSLPEGACPVQANEDHLTQMVRALVDNALKFSPDRKVVRIVVTFSGKSVTLTISDAGMGFSPEWARELFLPFTITDSQHFTGGTAMNLARVKAIARAHGGQIMAHSEGKGKGATFVITLPRAPSGGADAESADEAPAVPVVSPTDGE